MQLKDIISSPCGISFMLEQLDLQSGYARRYLLDSAMMTSEQEISASYDVLRSFLSFINNIEPVHLNTLLHKLMCLKDMRGTIENLKRHAVLDDIELFEIKHLAMLTSDVKRLLEQYGFVGAIKIPVLDDVISILDPDGMRIATFYVYDSYSDRLKELRALMRKHPERQEELFIEATKIEDEIRSGLSAKLHHYAQSLEQAQTALAMVDIALAKARQMQHLGLSFPTVSTDERTTYCGMFHPQVKDVLAKKSVLFQPVSISIGSKPTLITGANMGGKTVVLKTLTLCQYLYQFGFGIPADNAAISVKDEIYFCIGDEQSVEKGLSSFAAEMKNIDAVIKASRKDRKVLALIDEPARTTNPVEGTALVQALLSVLASVNVSLVMTTHYDIEPDDARCLRVRGFEQGVMNYELVEVLDGEVPHEALNIAQSLGVDAEWLDNARKLLSVSKSKNKLY